MNINEQEIIQRIRNLSPDYQRRVLEIVIQLERPLSARELMRLPADKRQRRVQAAIDLAANEDFKVFEAYSEELIDG